MYSHHLIERAQATALFETRRKKAAAHTTPARANSTPSSALDVFSQSAEQDNDGGGAKRSNESPSEQHGLSFLHKTGHGCWSGGATCRPKIISGFRPKKPPRKLKTLAAAGLCIIAAPRANARNAPPGRRFPERHQSG